MHDQRRAKVRDCHLSVRSKHRRLVGVDVHVQRGLHARRRRLCRRRRVRQWHARLQPARDLRQHCWQLYLRVPQPRAGAWLQRHLLSRHARVRHASRLLCRKLQVHGRSRPGQLQLHGRVGLDDTRRVPCRRPCRVQLPVQCRISDCRRDCLRRRRRVCHWHAHVRSKRRVQQHGWQLYMRVRRGLQRLWTRCMYAGGRLCSRHARMPRKRDVYRRHQHKFFMRVQRRIHRIGPRR